MTTTAKLRALSDGEVRGLASFGRTPNDRRLAKAELGHRAGALGRIVVRIGRGRDTHLASAVTTQRTACGKVYTDLVEAPGAAVTCRSCATASKG